MTLQELRRARKKTQAELANSLGIAQKQISKLEERTDMHISTLRRTVEAMGGRLTLVAEFPDRQPVSLSGITTQDVVAQPSFLSKPSHRKGVSRGAAGHPKSGGTKTRLRA
ncbi:XRE family transcriptional regulator [Edaphobacter aggregans]|uniref:helix-turn-helix domain-containing protein n=1 Tax=Edaphobacter aggregans TaxID=570835 RepID=UPI001FE015F4